MTTVLIDVFGTYVIQFDFIPLNASLPIELSFVGLTAFITAIFAHPLNALASIFVSPTGRTNPPVVVLSSSLSP